MNKLNTPFDNQRYQIEFTINHLKMFIELNDKSKYNPMYYLYYPAKASVIASKIQLKACLISLKELNQ